MTTVALVAPCHRRAVERVIESVSGRLGERLPLRTLAELALLSPFHFHRVFRAATGVPPGRFLAALRIQSAKRLLLETDLSVSDICHAVGYQSVGTFTTQFSRLVGVPPRRFRDLAAEHPDFPIGASGGRDDEAEEGPFVSGRLVGDSVEGLAFVGLFRSPLPEGRPAGCTLAAAPGSYRVDATGEGLFHVLAAVVPAFGIPFGDGDAWVGRSSAPVRVQRGWPAPEVDLRLQPRRSIDPPILLEPAVFLGAPTAA